jgi:hypothetical protein
MCKIMNVPVQFELTDVQLYTNKCAIESRNAYDLVLFQAKFILGSSSRHAVSSGSDFQNNCVATR